jgi:hypothetical protein
MNVGCVNELKGMHRLSLQHGQQIQKYAGLGQRSFDFFAVLPDTRVARIDPLISKGGVHKKNAA